MLTCLRACMSTCLHALARMLARLCVFTCLHAYMFTCLQAYSKIGPTSFQNRSKTGGNFLPPVFFFSRSTVQDRLKRSQNCSKMAQDHSKIGPRRPMIVPRSFQNGWQLFATRFLSKNTVQDRLKRPQNCSKMAQDHSKIGSRRPKIVPGSLLGGSFLPHGFC